MTTWIKHLIGKIRGRDISLPLIIYLVNIALLFAYFLPNLSDLNLWDEAAYINSGRMLMEGEIKQFAGSPLPSLMYGVFYLLVQKSPFWLLIADALGRIVIFTLFFTGAYQVARELNRLFNPLIMLGLLTTMPLVVEMYNFPSDPLFAALSAFTFWQVLRFYNTKQVKYLWFASLFLGLAACARNEGLVLLPILILAALVLSLRNKYWWRIVLACIIPFTLIVGGYILFAGLITGDFNPGITERTYTNFEAGHEAIYNDPGRTNATIESYLEARRVFGTPEENDYSVFKAISRNPDIYFQRVKAIFKSFPNVLNEAYGIKFTVVLLLLAARGIWALIKRKEYKLIIIMVLWVTPLTMGFINTIIRTGYLRFPYFILYALACIGLQALVDNLSRRGEMMGWLLATIMLLITTLEVWKTAIFYGVFIFLMAILVAWYLDKHSKSYDKLASLTLLIFFCAGLILHGNYPGPKKWQLGANGDEAASKYMRESLPGDSVVLAGSPAAVWMSRLTFGGLNSTDLPIFENDADFGYWVCQNFEAIYIDHSISPYYLNLIEKRIGKDFNRVFLAEDGDYQVLQVVTPCK
jgi:hypothetical protein